MQDPKIGIYTLAKKKLIQYKILRKDLSLVNPEEFGYKYPKYHHHDTIEIIKGDGPFNHHKLI